MLLETDLDVLLSTFLKDDFNFFCLIFLLETDLGVFDLFFFNFRVFLATVEYFVLSTMPFTFTHFFKFLLTDFERDFDLDLDLDGDF